MTPLILWCVLAAAPTPAPVGLDLKGMDKKVVPGDDFFRYANGNWLTANPIPADRSSWGSFQIMGERANTRTAELIKEAGANPNGSDEAKKVGTYYQAYMDEAAIEAKGLEPLKAELATIAAIADKKQLAKYLGQSLRADVDALNATNLDTSRLFGLWFTQALDDPKTNVPYVLQGGISLPDREYYVSEKKEMAEVRTAYAAHIVTVLSLAKIADPDQKSKQVFGLELKIAKAHATRLESEEVHHVQPWKREELATKAPGLDWPTLLDAAQLGKAAKLYVWQPKAITGLSALVASESLDSWKAYLTFHAIDRAATMLPKAFVDESFNFYGKTLNGVPQLRERWKRGVDFTSQALPHAVGKLYVEKHFSPEAKATATAMVANIITAFSQRIDKLSWMSEATKAKAKAKVGTLTVGVGYPDVWPSYEGLEVKAGEALGNAQRAELFKYQRELKKLGQPVDKKEWWMPSQVVNAVNLPLQNSLNFPAAMLEPPFFDVKADPALNYGAMGAVIGHEISHSFDDQGSKFDAEGKLSNWWSDEDLAHFQAAAKQLAAQYSAYEALPGLHLNGELVLGENIADVAGLAVAYDGWKLSLGGKPAPKVQGLPGEQAFFLSFGQAWKGQQREPALRAQVVSNGHAPVQFRALTVRNLDAWYAAFGVKPKQKLFLAPADRVRVW